MPYFVHGSSGIPYHLFEPKPNKDGTANVVSNNPGFSALSSFNAGQLLALTVKLLEFPAEATYVLYYPAGYDSIRALGR